MCCAAGVLRHMVTPAPARSHLHASLVLGHLPSGELLFFHLKDPDLPFEGSALPLPGYVLFLKQLLLSLYLEVSGADFQQWSSQASEASLLPPRHG